VTASLLYLIVQFSGDGVVLSTLSLLLQRRFGEELTVAGLSIGIAAAGGLGLGLRSLLASLAGPIAGYVSDTRWGRWPVIAASLAFGIAGFAVLACATQLGSLATGLVLGSVGAGMALATLAALVGDLAPSGREGAVMGAYATAGDIGSTGGPFLAFALLTVVDLRWIYLFCSLTFVFGLGLIWNLHGRKR
jgi:MFS family permease